MMSMRLSRQTAVELGGALAIALMLPLVVPSTATASMMLVFAIAAAACNLLLGYTGVLSFAQAAFFGLGGYATGLMMIHIWASAWAGLAAGMAMGAVCACAVGVLTYRRHGIYLIMITLACGQMAFFAINSFPELTGGENGLLNIPRPPVGMGPFAMPIDSPMAFYAFTAVVFLIALAVLRRIVASAFGRALRAIRDNENRARAVGYNVGLFKLTAFAISGAMTGLAGGLYAMQLRLVPVSSVDFETAELILIMTIVGGTAGLLGPVIGAIFMLALSEQLSRIWPHWPLVVGVLLVAVVLSRRDGLWAVGQHAVDAVANRLGARRVVNDDCHSPD